MKTRHNPFLTLALALAASATLPTNLSAAAYTWDIVPADSGITGGTGAWNTANTNWTSDAGVTNISWPSPSTANDDAVFGGTAGTVTIDVAGITANDLTFNTANYIIEGGGLTLDGTLPVISVTGTATVNSSITSSIAGGFSKTGTGTLILGGSNTFTPSTTFAYGLSSATLGAIRLANNNALSGITLINGVPASGASLPARIELSNNITVTGTEGRVGGRANAQTTGAFLVNISGDNTWAGAVRIFSTGGGHGIRSDAGTLTISGAVNSSIGARTWEIGGAGNVAITGAVTTAVAITKFGAGTLTLSGLGNTYTGDTKSGAGSLVINHASALSGSALDMATADTGTVSFGPTITAATLGSLKGSRNLSLLNTAGSPAAVTLTVGANNATNTYTGQFSGSGHLYKTGSGTQTLDPGAVSISIGSLSANGGSLKLKSGTINTTGIDPAVAAYVAGVGARGGILSVEGANLIVGNSRTFKPGASTNGTVNVLSGSVTSSGGTVIGHNGTVVMTQSGGDVTTTSLYHQDAGAGTYNLTGGTLVARSIYNNTAGAHTFTLNLNGGTLKAATSTTNLITTANTGNQISVLLGEGNTAIDTSDSDAAIIRPMGDMSAQAGTFTKVGVNTLTLSAVNTYSGNTVISNGTLATGVDEAIPFGAAKGNVILDGGGTVAGTLNLAGQNISINGLSGLTGVVLGKVVNNTSATAAVLSVGNNDATSSFAGILANNSSGTGTLGLIKTGSGTLTLSGANTYTDATSVTAGTLALVGGSQESPITVDSGATLGFTIGLPTSSTSTVTFSGLTPKVAVTGTPVATTLMTASSITGTPVLDPAIPGFALQVTATELKLVASGTPYGTWAALYAPADLSNPALDNDSDGLVNQQEFAFGLNPTSGTSINPILVQLNQTTGTFTYQRRADSGLTYKILKSTTLETGSWTEDAASQVAGAVDGNGNETVVVTLSGTKPLGDTKLFVRVSAQ